MTTDPKDQELKITLANEEVKYLKEMVRHDEIMRLENLEGQADDNADDRKEDIAYSRIAGNILRKLS